MAGASAERQESALIAAINAAIRKNKNKPVKVQAGSVIVENIFLAKKYGGRQEGGSEPYTDVVLANKQKGSINLSLKGEAASSLAGGGLKGLELAVPGIAGKFMKAALKELLDMGLKKGDKVPDVYGKLSDRDKVKIVVGSIAMGGPIDYMYIGPMDVKSEYDAKTNTITLNGKLTEAKEYAETHELYFRLRARREDQTFDPDATQRDIPKIYGKSPSKGDSAGRIVVTDKVPKNAVIVKV